MKKILLTAILCLISSVAVAQNMTFEWDPVTTPGLTIMEYRVYMSDQSGAYGLPAWAGPNTSCTIDVPQGQDFVVVRAVSSNGVESPNSNELNLSMPDAPNSLKRVITMQIKGQLVIE